MRYLCRRLSGGMEITMKRIHIFNPVAGKGHSPEMLTSHNIKDEIYITQCVGDAARFVEEAAHADPETHFIVYGGDGTLNEAVNGILRAGAGQQALLSVVPTGTGNDTLRSLPDIKGTELFVDAMEYNGKYAINIINMGFDCSVVDRTQSYKRLPAVDGGLAYILGVADVLFHKMGEDWHIRMELENGETEEVAGTFLLTLAANGSCYGGGFKAASLAKMNDGLLDILIVPKLSRASFLSLVADYRKGTHLDPVTMRPAKKFEKKVLYRRCRSLTVEGVRRICADGEIEHAAAVRISVLPRALRMHVL